MSDTLIAPPPEVSVEAFDWIQTSRLSELVANFARVHILVSLFDGDPDKWIEFIRKDGTTEERLYDLPFVLETKRRIDVDPDLLPRMRHLVGEFSVLFARSPIPA